MSETKAEKTPYTAFAEALECLTSVPTARSVIITADIHCNLIYIYIDPSAKDINQEHIDRVAEVLNNAPSLKRSYSDTVATKGTECRIDGAASFMSLMRDKVDPITEENISKRHCAAAPPPSLPAKKQPLSALALMIRQARSRPRHSGAVQEMLTLLARSDLF